MAASIDFENILVFVDTVWNDDMDIIFYIHLACLWHIIMHRALETRLAISMSTLSKTKATLH